MGWELYYLRGGSRHFPFFGDVELLTWSLTCILGLTAESTDHYCNEQTYQSTDICFSIQSGQLTSDIVETKIGIISQFVVDKYQVIVSDQNLCVARHRRTSCTESIKIIHEFHVRNDFSFVD